MHPQMLDKVSGPTRVSPEVLSSCNINCKTLIANDFLNHYHEPGMLLLMLPSMPEAAEDILQWSPKSYTEYFESSCFQDKELAVALFPEIKPDIRKYLEDSMDEINACLVKFQKELETHLPELGESDCQRLSLKAQDELLPQIELLKNYVREQGEQP